MRFYQAADKISPSKLGQDAVRKSAHRLDCWRSATRAIWDSALITCVVQLEHLNHAGELSKVIPLYAARCCLQMGHIGIRIRTERETASSFPSSQ